MGILPGEKQIGKQLSIQVTILGEFLDGISMGNYDETIFLITSLWKTWQEQLVQ